ncbi:unnamed protein product [Closterium sp. NIES-53]
MAKKYDVTSTLIRWLLATEATCGSRVLCLHSDRGVEFRLGVLAEFCSDQGITQSWTLPGSLQQNGVAERCIGLVTEIARTSTIHALAVHFQWPYVVCYAAHQMNLWPRVSRPKASPTSLWTGVFLGFPVAALDFAFYLPPLHQFLNSHDIHFDESVSYYALPPSRSPGSIPSPLPRPHSSGTLAPPPLVLPRQCFKCRLPPHSPPHSNLSSLRHYRDRLQSTQEVLELEVLTLEVLVLGVLAMEVLDGGVLELEVLALEVLVLEVLVLGLLPLEIVVLGLLALAMLSPLFSTCVCSLASSTPISDYYRDTHPVVSCVLTSLVTHPRASSASISALTAAVADFAATRCLDFATRVMAAPPIHPLSAGGESALGCDDLEDRQFELKFLAAASPSLCAMLLSPEKETPTPFTYRFLAHTVR